MYINKINYFLDNRIPDNVGVVRGIPQQRPNIPPGSSAPLTVVSSTTGAGLSTSPTNSSHFNKVFELFFFTIQLSISIFNKIISLGTEFDLNEWTITKFN